jgi:hypothetical protein
MNVRKNPFIILFVAWMLSFTLAVAEGAKEKHGPGAGITSYGPAIMWSDPADIESRDLFYGPGGKRHAPRGAFTFVREDLDGTSPKFVVRDQDGVKWKVKLGIEARPETVASRIVWAVGYRANEDYFVSYLPVRGMPARLHRGRRLVGPDGSAYNARLKRESVGDKKAGNWRWRHNAFTGTRELNGLRVLMALLNNWDLKDVNNAIYQQGAERVYMVSDLGASFACAGRCWPMARTKGDLEKYRESRFIRRVTPNTVSFQTPARPAYVYLVNPKSYLSRIHMEWIGKDIPRADVKWIGNLLGRLSSLQIQDAFRAAGYSQQEVNEFSNVMACRIAALTDL